MLRLVMLINYIMTFELTELEKMKKWHRNISPTTYSIPNRFQNCEFCLY